MSILYNQSSYYDTETGIVYILKNNQLHPQTIQFSDSEAVMATKQFPTIVKVGYVEFLRQQVTRILNTLPGLGVFTLDLILRPNDPNVGPFVFVFKVTDGPVVQFSVAQLAYNFNSDPINSRQLRRYVIDELTSAGYRLN